LKTSFLLPEKHLTSLGNHFLKLESNIAITLPNYRWNCVWKIHYHQQKCRKE